MKQPLKAVSKVIELTPGKKYLLVFKTKDPSEVAEEASRLIEVLRIRQAINYAGSRARLQRQRPASGLRIAQVILLRALKKRGITCFGFALRKEDDLEVIEAA